MKRTIAAILSAAMMVTAAAAAEAPSSWAKSAVDTARNAGIVPEQVDQAYTRRASPEQISVRWRQRFIVLGKRAAT